jgi:hypothetical protein
MLARELITRGHVIRATTRDPARLDDLTAAGVEGVLADPDRVATVAPALEHVAVVCVLLGSAVGGPEELEALHGTRLDMLLTRILDSTVRGVLYESAGTIEAAVLDRGAARVRAFCEESRVPYALLDADPADHRGWVAAALAGVGRALGG